MNIKEGNRINSIDLIRTIAIILVIGFHFLFKLSCIKQVGCDNSLRPIGFVGISLFFIISGYMLARKYPEHKEFSLKWFLKKYIKIASLYYITLIVIAVLFFHQSFSGSLFNNLIVHFLFLDYFFSSYSYSIISSAWFLFPLIVFYFFYPFLNKFVKKNILWLLVFFIIMDIVRYADGNYTSLSPLFFLGEFCFGIAFAKGEKTKSLVISTLTIFIKPIMFISYPIFYFLMYFNIDKLNLKIINFIGKYTFTLFLFHEAFIEVILSSWRIGNLSKGLALTILTIIMIATVYASKRIENYLYFYIEKFKSSGK